GPLAILLISRNRRAAHLDLACARRDVTAGRPLGEILTQNQRLPVAFVGAALLEDEVAFLVLGGQESELASATPNGALDRFTVLDDKAFLDLAGAVALVLQLRLVTLHQFLDDVRRLFLVFLARWVVGLAVHKRRRQAAIVQRQRVGVC